MPATFENSQSLSGVLFVADPWRKLSDAAASAWPPARWRDVGVVVGCSGGADSVALLRCLCHLKDAGAAAGHGPRGFLIAAHFNHALRGEESEGDEGFVAELARELGLPLELGRAETTAADEASMRAVRLSFLRRVAERSGARYIAVGHSADDNVETVLHHLMRGTGPAGLAGIAPHRAVGDDVVLVRPLLGVRRTAIREALRSIGQRWREDSSNANPAYRRNWIRGELIPRIESHYPHAVEAIARAAEGQRSWRGLLERLAQQWLDTHGSFSSGSSPSSGGNGTGDSPSGSVVELFRDERSEPAVVIVALQMVWNHQGWPRRDMAQRHWQRLSETLRGEGDQRYSLPGAVEVSARGRSVTLWRPRPGE